jgi:hypothetical protein
MQSFEWIASQLPWSTKLVGEIRTTAARSSCRRMMFAFYELKRAPVLSSFSPGSQRKWDSRPTFSEEEAAHRGGIGLCQVAVVAFAQTAAPYVHGSVVVQPSAVHCANAPSTI